MLFERRVVRDDGEAGQHVQLVVNGERRPRNGGEGAARRDLFRPDCGFDAARFVAPPARDEPERAPFGVRRAHLLVSQTANALPAHFFEFEFRVHQDVRQRARLDGRVPAVNVVRRVCLGYPHRLRAADALVERSAGGDLVEDDVRRRVEHAPEREAGARREANRGRARRPGTPRRSPRTEIGGRARAPAPKFAVGVDDGALVGRDDVGAVLKPRAHVRDGGLARQRFERSHLEHHVAARGREPLLQRPSARARRATESSPDRSSSTRRSLRARPASPCAASRRPSRASLCRTRSRSSASFSMSSRTNACPTLPKPSRQRLKVFMLLFRRRCAMLRGPHRSSNF